AGANRWGARGGQGTARVEGAKSRGLGGSVLAAVAGAAPASANPVGHLLGDPADLRAQRGDVLAHLAEDLAEALGVELDGVAGLLAGSGLLVAGAVLAALDAVVVAALHPFHDLGHAAN